jgi:spore coat protein E
MASFREIISKAVISKGKKTFSQQDKLEVTNKPATVLGCWVINHQFSGVKQNNQIIINGSYDINIWYSYDDDTKTDVVKSTHTYTEIVKMKDIDTEYDNSSIIVRSLTDPKCVDVKIDGNTILYQVDLELGIELVGDVKVKVEVDDNLDEYDLIEEENKKTSDEIDKIDEEVHDDYLDKE